jgi:hypothetical protein
MAFIRQDSSELLSLKEAAEKLGVPSTLLLAWNEHNILKPTITQSGEAGYTKEQIDSFIAIQNAADDQKNLDEDLVKNQNNEFLHLETAIQAQNKTDYSRNPRPEMNKKSFSSFSFLAISLISFLFFLTSFSVLAHRTGIDFMPLENTAKDSANKTKLYSKLNTSKSPAYSIPLSPDLENTTGNGLSDEGSKLEKSNLTALSHTNGSSSANKDNGLDNMPGIKGVADFASRPNCPTCTDENALSKTESIFDANGNIKGEPKSELLALNSLRVPSVNLTETSLKNGADHVLLLGALTLGLFYIGFTFRNQLTYSGSGNIGSGLHKHENNNRTEEKRILEVNQRTDGTVLFSFQGVEHKVSKPELDSESDQFIARLMELASEGTKQIDYDTLRDEKIKFSTPLSKLVTRLGFVGIKRDLFFPRTSKNKVLFRRYVTEQDLYAMSLTPDEINLQLQ